MVDLSTRHVAFMRNVNQGQAGHPSATQLVEAFAAAGCANAATFQSNGTVLFDAGDEVDPGELVDAAREALLVISGVDRAAFWMPVVELEAILAPHVGVPDLTRWELTIHGQGLIDASSLAALEAERLGRCRIEEVGPGWAMVHNSRDGQSNGTPVVERITGSPASSRGLPSLVRLLDRVRG